jgi:hypothetical protein
MSSPFDVIAIIMPKPGKADRVHIPHPPSTTSPAHSKQVQELLTIAAKAVKENEPGTLRYHLQREVKGDAPTFVMLET